MFTHRKQRYWVYFKIMGVSRGPSMPFAELMKKQRLLSLDVDEGARTFLTKISWGKEIFLQINDEERLF